MRAGCTSCAASGHLSTQESKFEQEASRPRPPVALLVRRRAGTATCPFQPRPDCGLNVVRCPYLPNMPMKISQIIRLLEADGWRLKRVTGSHRHFTHAEKPGLVTVAGKPSATLKPKTEASILKQALLGKEER